MNEFPGAEIFIPLTQAKVAVIDFADRQGIVEHRWHAVKMGHRFYAVRNSPRDPLTGKQKRIFLHRELMKPGPPEQIDHKFGNTLDNRRGELRLSTRAQNAQGFRKPKGDTSSKFRGVNWYKAGEKWQAHIQKEGRLIYLGRFEIEEDAARAYDKAAREHFGEFAQPNFPYTQETPLQTYGN